MNSKAERKNETFTELVVAIMLSSSATSFWWGKILLTIHYQKIHFQHRLFRTFYIGSKTDVESADVECMNVNIGFGEPMLACIWQYRFSKYPMLNTMNNSKKVYA